MTTSGLTTTATNGDLSIDPNGDGKTVVTGLFKLTPGTLSTTCDSSSRGSLVFVTNAEGGIEDDALYLCARKSSDQNYGVSFGLRRLCSVEIPTHFSPTNKCQQQWMKVTDQLVSR